MKKINQELDAYISRIRKLQRKYEGKPFIVVLTKNIRKVIMSLRRAIENIKHSPRLLTKFKNREVHGVIVEPELEGIDNDKDTEENLDQDLDQEQGQENEQGHAQIQQPTQEPPTPQESAKHNKIIIIRPDSVKIKQSIIRVLDFMDSYLSRLDEDAKQDFVNDDTYELYKMVMRRYLKKDGSL